MSSPWGMIDVADSRIASTWFLGTRTSERSAALIQMARVVSRLITPVYTRPDSVATVYDRNPRANDALGRTIDSSKSPGFRMSPMVDSAGPTRPPRSPTEWHPLHAAFLPKKMARPRATSPPDSPAIRPLNSARRLASFRSTFASSLRPLLSNGADIRSIAPIRSAAESPSAALSDSRLSSTAEATRESLRSRHDLRSTGSTSGPAVLIRMATWICCDLLNRTAAATRAAASRDSDGRSASSRFSRKPNRPSASVLSANPSRAATRNGAGCRESSISFSSEESTSRRDANARTAPSRMARSS